jgi:DNA-binding NtrC family response regulator
MEIKGNILYAEDDSTIRNLLSCFIYEKLPNYDIEVFSNGNSLKNRLEELLSNKQNVKLILTDNDMTKENEGINIIEEYSPKINLPFILMSGYNRKTEAIKAGAYGFIEKPFNLNDFSELIERAIKNYKR